MRHFVAFILCTGLLPFSGKAQDAFDPEKTFYDAEFLIIYENYEQALPLYLSLVDSGFENANVNYKIGNSYLNIPGKKQYAISYLEKAVLNSIWKSKSDLFTEKQAPFDAELSLAVAYHVNNQLDKAHEKYTLYKNEGAKALEEFKANLIVAERIRENLDIATRGITSCDIARQMMENPVDNDFRPVENINIGTDNFNPSVSGNGNVMVFMSNRKYYDAVYISRLMNTKWDTPDNITMEIESDGTFYPVSLSFDGLRLLLIHKESTNFDLFESVRLKDRWSRMVPLNNNINTTQDEIHACFSPDGKTLYFVSNRKGGEGGFDIYKSEYDPDGGWGAAVNLGQPVNSPYDEHCPFFSEDGNTLYFSSIGHTGMGGYDIFRSHKQPDGGWSEPVNIGFPVNSTDDDLFFSPRGSGELAYMDKFVSDGSNRQIYEIEFYSESNPRKAQVVGMVDLEDTQYPLERDFQISLINIQTGDTVTSFTIQNINGEYSFRVNPGDYQVVFEKAGYEKKSESLAIGPEDRDRTFELNTTLEIESQITGETEIHEEVEYIGYVLFAFDDYSLSKTATRELDHIYQVLEQNSGIMLKVIGHTDSKGSDTYNISLSKKRARTVSEYMSKKGIDPGRLETIGIGESEPAAINQNPDGSDNPEGRRFNRRVVFAFRNPVSGNIEIKTIEIPDHLKIK
ncbi:MAG: PD40 domain-containing protein [Bacteroidales bacterium]|nr:MAG: PD40 domain-containing protein [Bacteroidales bacterium]